MEAIKKRMSQIKHKIAIISGKGGVGKSLVTVNLAASLAKTGKQVGVLDADLTGPTVPKMLGLKGNRLQPGPAGIGPADGPMGIKVVSMDYLLMDLPPGTGDESLSILQLLPDIDGVVIVTIPSEVSQAVVKKSVTFARQMKAPILGIVENMAGLICPHCGEKIELFSKGGGAKVSDEMGVDLLGSIPIDPKISADSDMGTPFVISYPDSPAAKVFSEIVAEIEKKVGE
jgi:ATP-binding protein involved in chromosome partitioning